jgi:hypothetical protein
VLASDPSAAARPSGSAPLPGVAVLAGSTASQLMLGPGTVDSFAVGDMIAVDVDYQQQTGWVGTGIAAAYVKDPADVQRDIDYVRRVTFNVARVAEKTTTSLLLAQALLGGVPAGGASLQKVVALVDREGGSFFQDWSALFVWQEESGGRVCFYYPRLSPSRSGTSGVQRATVATGGALATTALGMPGLHPPSVSSKQLSGTGTASAPEAAVAIGAGLGAISLHASFEAFPYADVNDGEAVLCYRSYVPASAAAMY